MRVVHACVYPINCVPVGGSCSHGAPWGRLRGLRATTLVSVGVSIVISSRFVISTPVLTKRVARLKLKSFCGAIRRT